MVHEFITVAVGLELLPPALVMDSQTCSDKFEVRGMGHQMMPTQLGLGSRCYCYSFTASPAST